MSSTQFLTDATTRHAVFLQRYAGGRSKEALILLNRIKRDIIIRLAQEPTVFQRNRLEAVLKDVEAIMVEGFNGIALKVNQDASELALAEAKHSTAVFNKASSVNFTLPADDQLISAVATQAMAVQTGVAVTIEEALSQFSKKKQAEIANIIADGVTLGDTTPVISKKVSTTIDTLNRRQVDTLVRTVANHASSVSRQQVYNANSDLMEGYQWIATLDSRTTLICFPAETSVIPLGALENVFRRKYAGDMITITTASGKQITGTPNHPILTSSGWLPLNEIEPSKHVIYSPSFDTIGVVGDHNIGMPSTISQLYDSVRNLPTVDIELKGSTTEDFHGDGDGGNSEVHILSTECELRYTIKLSLVKRIKNNILRFVHNRTGLLGSGFLFKLFSAWFPAINTPKINAGGIKGGVDSGFTMPCLRYYFRRPNPVIKKFNNALNSILWKFFVFAPPKAWHHSRIFKHVSDGCCGRSILPSQTGSGLPISVFADNVISKSSEFKICHVYNLQSSLGLYIAGGAIVKNCASRDKKIYQAPHGPMPPAHWGCRSTTIPKLKPQFDLGASVHGERPSRGGDGFEQVSAKTTYGGWLKSQPKDFVDEALGVERSKLFRSGKFSIDKFVDPTGRTYTLKELESMSSISMIQ